MAQITAALVEHFGEPPHAARIPEPEPRPGREVVEVLAVGLHHITRGIASGRHYASPKELPFVPGVDGVVRRADGTLAYVGGTHNNTLAERILIDPRDTLPLPVGADPATVAASVNPALSSWVALHARTPLRPGMSVLVLGATGASGALAVPVARHLGAGRVIVAGRNRTRLDELLATGADAAIALTDDPDATAARFAAEAADVDVVLDYLWGAPTELAMRAIVTARRDRERPIDWVHIGSVAGPDIALDGALLRASALRVSGSGLGSVDLGAVDLPGLIAGVASGAFAIRPRPVPLADIAEAWTHQDAPGERTVVIP
ncbi:quinone oxidoreductase family protein [Protaetiibacter intestinalis]|uniref:Zinc-binding alcohol dehydrogenase family protein n=1 Tax=Protaetiibacter intestinalis TaxID=2419774 RepID=A0A387BEW1_9MICO|nr:zinc-binding alcohol dehydrogenase family protein [Protaetiibacter intestinalis]AYF97020.1 zinc-binding alcohol dehydrogenase family protein [Protaetiibacter intestinalis]